ncbi:6-carboxytetrahydropterin synthase [Aliikangiella sp. IMCC44632]
MQALFVDNLTVIDFSYFDPARGIVGESLILDVELFGELNQEGMLFDFSFVKKRIKSSVDSLVDHKFLVAKQYPKLTYTETPTQLSLNLETLQGDLIEHISPHQAVHFVNAEYVTPQAIVDSIQDEIKKILPNNVTKVSLNLREEAMIQNEFYHYSHGLKKHFGDCQRIAHGHRSKIEIWENGERSPHWQAHIAKAWKDIYLATEEDIIERKTIDQINYLVFQYHANQGLFQLMIAEQRCDIITTDTTVELIAVHLANYLKKQAPQSAFKVKAYEGVDKGAIAIAD